MLEWVLGGMRAMSRLGERVEVMRDGADLVSADGGRRFVSYGDIEWAWWIEVTPDGGDLRGLWELWDDEGVLVCMCG